MTDQETHVIKSTSAETFVLDTIIGSGSFGKIYRAFKVSKYLGTI